MAWFDWIHINTIPTKQQKRKCWLMNVNSILRTGTATSSLCWRFFAPSALEEAPESCAMLFVCHVRPRVYLISVCHARRDAKYLEAMSNYDVSMSHLILPTSQWFHVVSSFDGGSSTMNKSNTRVVSIWSRDLPPPPWPWQPPSAPSVHQLPLIISIFVSRYCKGSSVSLCWWGYNLRWISSL